MNTLNQMAPAAVSEDTVSLPDDMLDLAARIIEHHIVNQSGWDKCWDLHWQCIRGMSYLYVCQNSPRRGAARYLDEMAALYRVIENHELPGQRMAGHLADTREILGPELVRQIMPGIDALLTSCADEFMRDVLIPLRHVTHFVSANQWTSTNHVAMYACAVYRIGMVLDRLDYRDAAISTWDRLVADQHPDGYWEETTGGPTPVYNNLTVCCAGRMELWTKFRRYHDAAQRGALFHRRFSYPDGCNLDAIDGRVRHHPFENDLWGGFVHSETAEGRAFVRRRLLTRLRRLPTNGYGPLSGEVAALLCENHQYWQPGPIGIAEIDRQHYVERLRAPGAVRKHGPWFVCLQGIAHFPVGGFTIDRTSLFSLWHEKSGLIVNGSGEFGPNPAQTFAFKVDPHICHIPERTSLSMGAAGSRQPAKLSAEYAGGTASLKVTFDSEHEITIHAAVAAKMDRYPIVFTLQLDMREGQTVNGVRLSQDKKEFTAEELDGRIESGRIAISFPARGATLKWPHDPYNPYDLVNFRSPPDKYVSLLQLPIGPEGITLRIAVR